jgi:hypothetical protein
MCYAIMIEFKSGSNYIFGCIIQGFYVGKCRDPPIVPNAFHDAPLDQKVFALGTQLTYACRPGFSTSGFVKAMCVGEGRWVSPRIECARKLAAGAI